MTDFLNSLKTDLLDRRVRLVLGLLLAGLLAALVYAATGGGGPSSVRPAASPASGLSSTTGIAVSPAATNPNEAVAEVTSGGALQRRGLARDPFALGPGVLSKTATSSSVSTSSTATSKVSSVSAPSASKGEASPSTAPSKTGSSGSSPAPAPKHHAAKPQPVYRVSVQLGPLPAGTPPQSAQLPSYQDVRVQQSLPSAQQPLVAFAGVTTGGHGASFKLLTEAIVRGQAVCVPSVTQCEAIALKPGESEELEYVQAGAAPVVYLLRVVSIKAVAASSGSAKAAGSGAHVASRPLLDETGHAHSPAAVVLVREEPARPTTETVVVVPQGR